MKKDADFLRGKELMDYSLLLGVEVHPRIEMRRNSSVHSQNLSRSFQYDPNEDVELPIEM